MKALFKKRLENLEKRRSEKSIRRRSALIVCDSALSQDFDNFKVDAEVILIAPDNGHRGPGKTAPKGGYSVYYP